MLRYSIGLLVVLIPLARTGAQLRAAAPWPGTDSWITTTQPTCGAVWGRVIRWPSGFHDDTIAKPFADAFVQLVDSTNNSVRSQGRNAVGTSAAGEFRLQLPSDRRVPAILMVRAIGYEPAMIALDVTRYRAFVVEIELRSLGMHDPQLGLSVHAVRGTQFCAPDTTAHRSGQSTMLNLRLAKPDEHR